METSTFLDAEHEEPVVSSAEANVDSRVAKDSTWNENNGATQTTADTINDKSVLPPSYKTSPHPMPSQITAQPSFAISIAANNPTSNAMNNNGASGNNSGTVSLAAPSQTQLQSNPVNHKRLFGELSVNMRSFDSMTSPDPMYFSSPFFMDGISPGIPDVAQLHQHMQIQAHHAQVQAAQNYEMLLDGKAIVDDYLSLSESGECGFETVSRKVHRRVWNLSEDQKRGYFESVANALLLNPDPEIASRVYTFTKGSMFIGPLATALIDAYNLIQRKADAVRMSVPKSSASPSFATAAFTRSPWQTVPSNTLIGSTQSLANSALPSEGAELTKQHSLMLDDSRWIVSPSYGAEQAAHAFTPGNATPSSTAASNGGSSQGSQALIVMDGDGNNNTLSKHNARKKTISALNRMKQFVVPSDVNLTGTNGSADSSMNSGDRNTSTSDLTADTSSLQPQSTNSTAVGNHQSNKPMGGVVGNPSIPLQSSAFDVMTQNFASYGIRQAAPRSYGGGIIVSSPQQSLTPVLGSLTSIAPPSNVAPRLSPSVVDISNMTLHHKHLTMNAISAITSTNNGSSAPSGDSTTDSSNVVCRRKKTKLFERSGPKGVSRTGSTWRVQVQVRSAAPSGIDNGKGKSKYRFSRYIADYKEALWMYEVAILLSDRPRDLAAQLESGNYHIMLQEKIVSGPDNYYLELGVHVSCFVHAERSKENNGERIMAIQAYDAMKPLSGLSLQDMGQSIANLGPVYASVPSASWPANTIPMHSGNMPSNGASTGVLGAGNLSGMATSGSSVVSAITLQSMGRVIRNSPLMTSSSTLSNASMGAMAPSAMSGGSNGPSSISSPSVSTIGAGGMMMMPLATMPGAAAAGASGVGIARGGGNLGPSRSSNNSSGGGSSITNISIPAFSISSTTNNTWNTSTSSTAATTNTTSVSSDSIAGLKSSEKSNASTFTPPQAAAAMTALSMLGDVAANFETTAGSGSNITTFGNGSVANLQGSLFMDNGPTGPSPLSAATGGGSRDSTQEPSGSATTETDAKI